MPPHGSKRSDGSRSCGQIGQSVKYESPEDSKRRVQAETAELLRKRDEELKEAARRRELDRLVDEDRRKKGLPPLRDSTARRPDAALLAVLALAGASPAFAPRGGGGGRPRFPRPR